MVFPSGESAGPGRVARARTRRLQTPHAQTRSRIEKGARVTKSISDDLKSSALFYHREPRPGKLEIQPTKPLGNQRDLALAYSPGVAAACEAIVEDPGEAATLTARQNLVGVVTNGTAVLGLGNIGPLASKPVMEGKAVLFKKFAGIDVFDIEIAQNDVEKLVEAIAALGADLRRQSTSRTSRRPSASRWRSGSRPAWASPSSTTTSTAPRSSSARR